MLTMHKHEMLNELQQFWPTGRPIRVLATQWGCSVGYVSSLAKRQGLPSRQVRSSVRKDNSIKQFRIRIEAREYFEAEAERRGLMPRQLEAMLIQIIANDRLVDAIVDDKRAA
jgi:hypothetical protein